MANYTLNEILGNPQIVGAVIDRSKVTEGDRPFWRDYLTFREVNSDIFATAYGAKSAVRMGSVIDAYSEKPVRGRDGLTQGTLQVATLGDRFQMDNARLEQLQALIDRLNRNQMDAASVTEITDFLTDDFRELILAPEKRMDKLLADLLVNGAASITLKDNPKGVQVLDLEIPTEKAKATGADKGKVFAFLQKLATKYRRYRYKEIVLSDATFNKFFMLSDEFKALFKSKLGTNEATVSGLLTPEMLSALFKSFGLPSVRVVANYVRTIDDQELPLLEEGKMAFIPEGQLGYLRWKETYESTDPVPGITYTRSEGGVLVATERNKRGRFMEYECKWVPEITQARSVISVDVTATAL